MSDYSITKLRISQWLGIIMMVGVFAGAYYYWSARAGVKQNTASSQPQGVGRLDSGLAGYWAMDNGSGTSATDSSTNGNTGTLTNGPTWTTGQIGTAVDFDGTDDKISIATSPSLELTTKETISAWIYLEAVPSSGNEATILYKNSSGDSNFLYRFSVYNNGSNTRLIFVPGGGGGFSSSNTALTTSRWYHVMVTFDRPEVKFYLDGVLDGSSTDAVGGGFASGSGTTHIGGGGSGMVFLNGRVDEVRVYNRALSADEAGQLYRLTAPTSVDTSLKGYWSFDGQDMTATTAYDRSGAGKNLTLNNSPTPAGGRVGQGLSFDGTNDYASATYTPSGPNTLSAWIYPRSFADNPGIVGQLSPNYNSYGWGLSLDTSGNVHAISGNDNITWYNNLVAPVPLNQWSYVTATFSNCCNVAATGYLYINGVQVASYTGTADTYPYNFAIGARDNTSGTVLNYFNGSIDEVRIYNRALTATEIKSLYDIAAPDKTNSSSSQAQGSGRLDSGLAGYWKFDDASGATATDASTNGNNATLTGATQTWVSGQIGGALDFNGLDDIGTVPYSASLTSSTALSYSFWIQPDLNDENGFLGSLNGEDGSGYNFIRIDNSGTEVGNPRLTVVRDINGVALTRAVQFVYPVSTWFHGVYTYDGAYERLYINGNKLGEWAQTGSFATNTEYGLVFGKKSSSIGTEYDGALDEIRMYNRSLSSDEVTQLYRLTSPTSVDTNLKGYWSFNGKDMSGTTTVYDRSGLGSNGTLTNSPAIINGIVGQGLSFDGTNDYVDLGVATPYQFANTTFTVTGWFKSSPSVNGGAFVAQGGIAGQGGWFVGLNGDTTGKLSAVLKNTDGGQTGRLSSKTGFNDNNWHQFAFIVTTNTSTYASNTLVIYADGVLQPSTANSDSTSGGYDIDGSTALLGSRGSASDAFFNGGLDEVRIYNRALTAAEIQSQYDAVKPDKVNSSATQAQGVGRLDSGLAGYWKLDETTGSTATDSSTGGNNGTLSNMENGDWVAGQIGNGLSFDGTNESVTVSAGTGVLNASQNVTLSTWVYPRSLGAYQGYIYKGVSGCSEASASYMLENNSYPVFWVGGSSLAAGDSTLVANQWQHLVATNSAGGSAIYLNGVLIKSGAALPAPSTSSEDWSFNYCNRSDANLDEIRIYNRALSADEVSQLYRLGTPTSTDTSLKGYWSFNGKDISGVTAADRSGSGYTGTLTSGPTVINGKLGQGLSFDGVDDYVNLPTVPSALFTNTTSTMTGWFKTSSSAGQGILSQDHCSGGWFIRIESGTLSVSLRAGGSCGGGSASRSSSATNLANGVWHHFAVVMTTDTVTAGNNNVVIYIDGVLNQGSLTSGLVYGTAADNKVQIGTRYSGDQPFSGSMDEFRIYNRALTASEVLGLYNTSR